MTRENYTVTGAALVISLAALFISLKFTQPMTVDSISYMEVIAGFMGVSSAFIVGWQILSSMQVRDEQRRIESVSSDLKNEIIKLNNLIVDQKKTIEDIEKEKEKIENKMLLNLLVSQGLAFTNIQLFHSASSYIRALKLSLDSYNAEYTRKIMNNTKIVLSNINEIIDDIESRNFKSENELPKDIKTKIVIDADENIEESFAKIETSKNFEWIKSDFESLKANYYATLERRKNILDQVIEI